MNVDAEKRSGKEVKHLVFHVVKMKVFILLIN